MPEPKLSQAQFAEKLKSKYPQYAGIDDVTLIDRVLQKYPQYGSIVDLNDIGEEVKKKEFSEVSVLRPTEGPSASDTSTSFMPKGEAPLDTKVPEALKTAVSTPKFEPTKAVETKADLKQDVTTKDWWADKWNGLIEGVQTFAANVSDENNMNGEAIADFIQDNKSKKPELFASFNENLELLKGRGYDDISGRGMAANIAYTDSWRKDNKIEDEVLPYIRQKGREKSTENFGIQIDEKVQKELGDRFFSSAVRGLATSTPAMLTSASTMGMSFFNMSYNNAEEQLARQLAENPNLNMTSGERETYKVTNAGIEAVLERVGLSNALRGNPMLKRAITGKVLTRLAGVGDDVGAEAFEKIVKQEVKGLAGYARKVAAGSISEFETGALQQLSNDLINQYVTDSQGKNIFSPKTTKEIITDVLYAGAQEAVGGGIISGAVAPFQKSALEMTKQEFESGVDFAKKVDIQKVSEYLNKEVETGKITEGQASQTLDRIQEFNDLSNKLPDDISKQGQYELFQLIAEKQRLQKSVVGKDEVIQQTITEDVNAINQRIKEVYDTQKEAGVPSPVAEGEVPIEVQPVEGTSQEATEAGGVLQVPVEEVVPLTTPTAVTDVVSDFIDRRVSYTTPSQESIEGFLYDEGAGKLVVEDDRGNKYDIGNVDDVGGISSADLGVSQAITEDFDISPKGNFVIRGQEYVNQYSNPDAAIQRDSDGNVVSVNLETTQGAKRAFRGPLAETIAYNITMAQTAETINEVEAQVERPVSTVIAAPFFNTTVASAEEARNLRETPEYKQQQTIINRQAKLTGVEVIKVDESIGGFENAKGEKIVEVSNIIQVRGDRANVDNFAAMLGSMSVETQEATIAADYVKPGSGNHNADELTFVVGNIDGAIRALKTQGFYDFTINDSASTITILDFSLGEDVEFRKRIGNLALQLKLQNINYEQKERRALDSRYIGPKTRTGILGRIQEDSVQRGQAGSELRNEVSKAIRRNEEIISFLAEGKPTPEAVVGEDVPQQVNEQVVEQQVERAPVKNKLGLDEATIDRSIGNASRLLRKAKSDVQIITHNSTADYNKAIAENSKSGVDETTVEKGRYIPSRREIHINLQEVDTVTPFHEVFHAIFLDRYSKGDQATRERVAKNFYTQLRGILMDGNANDRILAESADIFASENGYSINEQPEEFLAQIAGYLSNNGNKISKSTTDKIIQWITNFINKFVPGVKISSRGELIDFMNSFSGAMFELTGKPMAPVINLKSTNDLLDSASRGAFTISYFEDTDQYKKFVDDGLVVNNFNLDQIAGQTIATHQPDNFMVGDVKIGDKLIVEGDGGVYFVLKFGEVWASGRASSASGIAKAINWSRENSTDGKGRMLLARGTTPKLISSTKGVKGGMQIMEEMVDRNLIPRKDFRASLIRVGKKYGIDFSGNDSMTSIKNDIEQKFMKPSDSTFAKRGSFFEDLISDISSTSAASKENIDGIRKFLGSKKRISFSKEGITSSIAELMTERMLIDLPSSHAYAVIEVDNDVKVEKSKKHDSYPYSIVQVDGKRPTLYLLKDRPKAVPSLLTKDGEPATNAKVGFAQMGYGRAIVNPALAAEAQQQNKPIESLLKESQSKQYKEGIQASEISKEIDENVSSDANWKARERNQFERFVDLSRIAIQDSLFGVIKIQEDIEYAKGNPVGLDEDFRNAEVLMHGKAKFDLNESEKLAKDVVKSIKKANIELESFDELIYALHAQERNRYLRIQSTDISKSIKDLRKNSKYDAAKVSEATGISIEDYLKIEDGTIERGITNEELVNILTFLGTTPSQFFYEYSLVKNGSGMSDAESQLILSSYGLDKYNPNIDKLSPDILDAVKNTYKIVADTRNRMLEFGLETKETIDAFSNTYKYYVPLRGFAEGDNSGNIIDGGRSLEVRGREKRALGRESKAESPFLQTVIQNQSTIIRGRKNEVAFRLYQLAEKNPNPDIWTTINPSVNKEYKKQITPKGIKLVAKSISDYILDPSNFAVRVGGEYKFIQFQDPSIAEALRGANVVKADFIAKYLGGFNRFLSSYITTYDPEFVLRNFSRDIQTAVINAVSEQEIEGGLLKGKNITNKIVKSVPNSIKAIFKMSGKDAKATSEFDRYYNEFLEDGAKTEWFYSKSVDELRNDVENLMSGKGEGALQAAKNFVERINSSVENGVRLAAYIESRKVGISRDKAAELAKNLTVNFNKKGSLGTVANSLYLFFNASVQGTSRLIRTLKPQFKKNDDGSRSMQVTTAQKIAISMFVAGSIMSVINEAISDDDEDGKSFYSKIPDFEKERNIIIMSPNGKDYIKIPLPYGLNVFYVAGNAMADAGQGIKSIGAVASNILKAAVGSFSPINFPSSEDFSSWLVKFVTPTIGQIPLSLALNENYFGQTIYNENFPTDPTPKPESELGRKNTTELNTWISKELNKITGGSEFRSGIIDINPDKTDFVLKTLSGGTGKFVIRSSKSGANLITGNWDELEASEIPFARVFYGQPKEFADLQSYFDKRIEVNQFMEEVRADKITGAEENRIREMYKVSKAVDGALRNLRKAERTADNIKDADKREDRLNELERKRYAQITNFQKAYEKYKIDKL